MDRAFATGGGTVSQTKFHIFEPSLQTILSFPTADPDDAFQLHAIPGRFDGIYLVYHGLYSAPDKLNEPFMSLGFYFDSIAYISDISGFPEDSLDFLKSKKISLLIIDALYPSGSYSSHFCFDQVLDVASILLPEIVYIVGTAHAWEYHASRDFFANHPRILACENLSKISFNMAFDGLILEFE